MAILLTDFLTPLSTNNIQVVVKDLEQNNICKIYADTISSLDSKLGNRTVNRWDIIRNNLIYIYLDDETIIENIPVTGVELDVSVISINTGETYTLVANVLPSDATNKTVTWVSMDESVVTVDNGVITSVSPGTTTVIVSTDDGGYSAFCEVTVSEAIIHVESIMVSSSSINLEVGSDPFQLYAIINPNTATDMSVTWKSSDESIATVVDGLVTAIGEGTATITVTSNDGGYTDTCEVVVSVPVVQVESVALNATEMTIVLGNTDFSTLTATVLPENAIYSEIIWSSSNEEVVIVDNGVLTPITIGESNITASVNGVVSEPCVVTVVSE